MVVIVVKYLPFLFVSFAAGSVPRYLIFQSASGGKKMQS